MEKQPQLPGKLQKKLSVIRLTRKGFSIAYISQVIEKHQTTINRWMIEDPEFMKQVEIARKERKGMPPTKECFEKGQTNVRRFLRVAEEFDSAHFLKDYPGDCSNMHGHRWKVIVEFDCSGLEKDEMAAIGIEVDFKVLKKAVKESLPDHKLLNELPEFKDRNPTAENIAEILWSKIQEGIQKYKAKTMLSSLELFETPNSSCILRRKEFSLEEIARKAASETVVAV